MLGEIKQAATPKTFIAIALYISTLTISNCSGLDAFSANIGQVLTKGVVFHANYR